MPSISARVSGADEAAIEETADLLAEDKSTVIRKALREGLADLRIRHAVGRYQAGDAGPNRAARMADVSLAEWLEIARERNLTSQLSPADLTEDAEAADRL